MTSAVSDVAAPLEGDMYDGLSARRHCVQVAWGADGLSVAGEGTVEQVGWGALTWIDALPEAILLGRVDRPGWRLRLGDDAPEDLVARLPRRPRFGRWIDAFGLGKSLACCVTTAAWSASLSSTRPAGWGARFRFPGKRE